MKLLRRISAYFGGSARAVGHVDTVEHGRVYGWAYFPNDPGRRCLVDVFVDGAFAGQALANLRRDDLLSAGVGDGAHGFELDIRRMNASTSRKLEVFALDASRTRLITNLEPAPTRTRAPLPTNAEEYLRETFRNFSRPIAATRRPRPDPSAPAALYERLLAPSPVDGPPICLGRPIGAYHDLVRLRGQQERLFEPSLTPSESAEFLRWYLSTYGRTRGDMRAPLSASDISFLNEAPTAGGPSNARKLFADLFAKTSENADALESAFVWGVFNAAVLSVEDCLISDADRSLMATPQDPQEEPYPLSPFMRLFIKGNPFLANLRVSTGEDRAFVYFVVLLFATAAPHLLKFTPPEWRDALLAENAEGRSFFDRLSNAIFAAQPARIDAETWKGLIASRDFDLRLNNFTTTTTSGSRIYAAARELAPLSSADVQVIGPVTRALGVGASCRRLVRALELTGYEIRCCDFSLDHPNKTVGVPTELSPLGPARVNILHLNLEELPKAIAYCADAFSSAHNIALPYLELAPLHPVQMLGLSLVDEVWAASRFIADTLASHAKTFIVGSSCDDVAPIGRELARSRAYGGAVSTDDFVFLTAGDALSSAHRKNPLGAARAFLHAFPNNPRVRLVIKTHSTEKAHSPYEQAIWRAVRSLAEADSRISLVDAYMDEAKHYALIEGSDALLSLHRAEGLGYHIIEAMKLGVPVIATAYSGNVDFCTDATAFLVPYRLISVEPEQYPHATRHQRWADPDHSAAVKQLRRVYEDYAAAREKADAARRLVADRYSTWALSRNVSTRLRELISPSHAESPPPPRQPLDQPVSEEQEPFA